jgi:lipoprotein-anchoring transpeptidase ErfK/SrfK
VIGHWIELLRVGRRPLSGVRFAQVKIVTAIALSLLACNAASAQMNPYFDSDRVYERAAAPRPILALKKHVARRKYPKLATAPADAPKPHGPLIIAISIDKQHLRIFDDNGVFAESVVSTGKPGHATPMGIFSVIEKNKWHRSNLYSSAPMPFMQRITWSGVALHAGVVPGYPASHGCIRLPMAFATKLWVWTKLGARVVITPGEVTPTDLSHPALIAHVPETPAVVPPPAAPAVATTGKSDRVAVTEPAAKLSTSPDDQSALRLDLAHDDAKTDAKAQETKAQESKPQETKVQMEPSAEHAEASPARVQLADASPVTAPDKISEPSANLPAAPNPAMTPAAAGQPQTAKDPSENSARDSSKDPSKDQSKDQSRAPDPLTQAPPQDQATKAPAPKEPVAAAPSPKQAQGTTTPKRVGHIAVLVSRKENRLYVRQNFEPLFDVPVVIAQSDRPLGTHMFLARTDATDPGAYRWSEISLPIMPKRSESRADAGNHRKQSLADVAVGTPDPKAAVDALDRITIPKDANARIAEAMAAGASLVITDRGLGDETGLGTDFIVPLH